jgi:hypothetical protein
VYYKGFIYLSWFELKIMTIMSSELLTLKLTATATDNIYKSRDLIEWTHILALSIKLSKNG